MEIQCIRPTNKQAHIDIQKEMLIKRDGIFTFTLKVNRGNVTDCVFYEYRQETRYPNVPRQTRAADPQP